MADSSTSAQGERPREVHMDGLQQLGIDGVEMPEEPVSKNVLIGVGGVLLVIAALIPITAAVITVVFVVTTYVTWFFESGMIGFLGGD
ncbi:hypothetical protein ACFFRL_19200 [Agromyces hippuratus]